MKCFFTLKKERNFLERSKSIFFSQNIGNNEFINNILNLRGYNTSNKYKNTVTLLIDDGYENKTILQEAAEKLNKMFLRDEQDRLVNVKVQGIS